MRAVPRTSPERPGPGELRRTLRTSVVEGGLYAGMVALGEVWFVADVVRLGGGALAVVLAATLPLAVGSLGALGGLRRLAHRGERRPLVVASVVGQAAVLAALSALTLAGVLDAWGVIGLACLYHGFGQAAATGWSSWFGDLVPAAIRGRYFGRRTGWVHGATFAGLLVGGTVLHLLEPRAAEAHGAGGLGYGLLFAAAACFRLGSAALLRGSWEPSHVPAPSDGSYLDWLTGEGGRSARRLLPTAAAFLAAVCIASPLFAPFELEVLEFSYPLYMVAQGVIVLVKLLSLPAWGRAIDGAGPRRTWPVAALLVSFVPVPWIFADGPGLVLMAQVLSGLAWGGYEVSLFSLMLASTPSEHRARLFATHSVLAGAAQLGGGLLGAALFVAVGGEYRTMFAITAGVRLCLVPLLPPAIRSLVPHGRLTLRDLAVRVVGLRPHGGLALRPTDEPARRRSA